MQAGNLTCPFGCLDVKGEVLNVTFLQEWTFRSSSLNCTFKPNYAATLEGTKYLISCETPWNISVGEEPLVVPRVLIGDFDITQLSTIRSEKDKAVFWSYFFGGAFMITLILSLAYLLYVEWWSQREE